MQTSREWRPYFRGVKTVVSVSIEMGVLDRELIWVESDTMFFRSSKIVVSLSNGLTMVEKVVILAKNEVTFSRGCK